MGLREYFENLRGVSKDQFETEKSPLYSKLTRNGSEPGVTPNQFLKDIVESLFTDNGRASEVTQKVFEEFDKDGDGLLNATEFADCYDQWIKPLLFPKSCLVVVDVQNDFIDGSLAIQTTCPAGDDGYSVVTAVNRLLETSKFDEVLYTLDWHPADHWSFVENRHLLKLHPDSKVKKEDAKMFDVVLLDQNPPFEMQLFTCHCVEGTHGANLHPDLIVPPNAMFVKKGCNKCRESFSGFLDNPRIDKTDMDDQLTAKGITTLYVCGIAYDYCVGSTASDGMTRDKRRCKFNVFDFDGSFFSYLRTVRRCWNGATGVATERASQVRCLTPSSTNYTV